MSGAVTMADLTPGTRVRHLRWHTTGTIKVVGDVTEIRWDGSIVADQVSPQGVVYPWDVEIVAGEVPS